MVIDAEFWNKVVFLLVIPALLQGYKIYKDRGGKPLSKLALQTISFGIAGIFTALNGGWIGLVLPSLPVFDGEIFVFVGAAIMFAGEVVAVVYVAWGSMMALYEGILKRIFETVGFAATEKVISRKRVGFLA